MTNSPTPNHFDAPDCKRRNPTISIMILVLSGIFILASLGRGAPAVTFSVMAGLDFLVCARLCPQLPPLAWAIWGLIFGGAMAFWLDAPLYGLRNLRWLCFVVPVALLFGNTIVVNSVRPAAPWPADPVAPPPPPVPAPNFAGVWDTGQWGTMTLTQDGNHVFGTYTYREGVIEGTTTPQPGGILRLAYKWRNGNSGVDGVGYFDLAAGAESFAGQWTRSQNLNGNGQEWNGRRTASVKPPPNFTGVWETEWGQIRLNQGVSTVTGTYAYGGGTINGNLDDKVLRFRWLNRATGETGVGKFTLALYGQTFTGTWNKSNNADLAGEAWNGRRVE